MKPSRVRLRPLYVQPIKAGFPNPAEEAGEVSLDLNQLIVRHPASTFYLRVDGDSMDDAGINSGDIVVVDKSLEPKNGDVVVAALDGEFTLKMFRKESAKAYLVPANPRYPKIEIADGQEFQIWGVVTYTIHQHRRG